MIRLKVQMRDEEGWLCWWMRTDGVRNKSVINNGETNTYSDPT